MQPITHMRYSIALFLLLALASCKNEGEEQGGTPVTINENTAPGPVDSANFTTVQWLDSLKDFGTVKEGEKVDLTFRFRNTGDKPLLVQSAVAGCGCTVPEYTREPVMPGKEGFIKAVFNSSGQPPMVHKSVSVEMNTKGTQVHTVSFMGEIKK